MGKIINKGDNMEIFNILICFLAVFYISGFINFIIDLWQNMPLKEEPSTPIYITKVIE